MAAFEYVAIGPDGRKASGVVSADNPRAARKELRLRQLTPLNLEETEEPETSAGLSRAAGLSSSDRVLITRQLAMLIGSGAPIEEAIGAVSAQAERPGTRRLLSHVRNQVAEGHKFSDALPQGARAFSPLYKSIVAAGETAGDLGQVMERLAVYLEKSQAVRRKVMTALIYPIVLSVVAIAVIGLLMAFVVPRVVEQFNTLGQELPLLTEIVILASELTRNWGWLIVVGAIGAVVAMRQALHMPAFKSRFDRFLLQLPIFGKLIRDVNAARFARTFATLLASRTPVLESLHAARSSVGNLVFVDAIEDITEAVREGKSFAGAMRGTNVFPPMLVHLAASGEAGSNLPALMEKGAGYLEDEFEGTSAVALGLLEPLIIVLLGVVVALIVLAIMLPILQLNSLAIG